IATCTLGIYLFELQERHVSLTLDLHTMPTMQTAMDGICREGAYPSFSSRSMQRRVETAKIHRLQLRQVSSTRWALFFISSQQDSTTSILPLKRMRHLPKLNPQFRCHLRIGGSKISRVLKQRSFVLYLSTPWRGFRL